MAKADLQALLNKAESMKNAPQMKTINIKGMELEIKRLPNDKYYDLKMGFGRHIEDGKAAMKLQATAVFDACPLLHDRQLQEACECVEPYDVVEKLFTPDEIMDIATALLDFDDEMGDGQEEALKN